MAQVRKSVAHVISEGGILACSLEWALTFQDLLATLDRATERAEKAEARVKLLEEDAVAVAAAMREKIGFRNTGDVLEAARVALRVAHPEAD